MEAIANTTQTGLTQIDRLASQAQILRASLNMNFMELARVLAEARPLVPHGQWAAWVEENADVSQKTASDMIAAYRRFAGKPQFEGIGVSKMFKMLALPAGTEDAFIEENDIENMTVRQVQEEVRKQAQAEAQAQIDAERRMRLAAERRAQELEDNAPPPIELVDELNAKRAALERAETVAQDAINAMTAANNEKAHAEREARKWEGLFNEQKSSYDAVYRELQEAKSAAAKGDAERIPSGTLTPDAFDRAARAFLAACSRMPTMGTLFATMNHEDWQEYDATLKSIERWARDSRRALDPLEGEVIYHD